LPVSEEARCDAASAAVATPVDVSVTDGGLPPSVRRSASRHVSPETGLPLSVVALPTNVCESTPALVAVSVKVVTLPAMMKSFLWSATAAKSITEALICLASSEAT